MKGIRQHIIVVLLVLTGVNLACAQQRLDTAILKQVPNVLVANNGQRITNATQWYKQRRPELLQFFTTQVYGQMPGRPKAMRFKVFDTDEHALGGIATRKQITVYFNGQSDGPQMDILLYIPNKPKGKVAAIVGLNFDGNQAVNADTAIKITQAWVWKGTPGAINSHATAASRGKNASQWPLEKILAHGYAVATVYRGEVYPDYDHGFNTGLHALYPELQHRGDNFATIGAWAWALSRVMDYLETDNRIDNRRVAVFGFSRLGKAALWAGATDQRFALVISNESGSGGAKLFHFTGGEGTTRFITKFPYWFCDNFKQYAGKDSLLNFDQHELISLIAPRPVYVASALDDSNSNPEAEFWSLRLADPVFKLLGGKGLPAGDWPAPNQSRMGQTAYHVRTGKHDVTDFDWEQYLSFADINLKKAHR